MRSTSEVHPCIRLAGRNSKAYLLLVNFAHDRLVEGREFICIDVHVSHLLLLLEVERWGSCRLDRGKEIRVGSTGGGADGGLPSDAPMKGGLSRYSQCGDGRVHDLLEDSCCLLRE